MSKKHPKPPQATAAQASTPVAAQPQPSPLSLSPGSLPVRLGPDHNSIMVSTSSGKDIWLLPTQDGMEMLLRLLEIEHRRTTGEGRVGPIPTGAQKPVWDPSKLRKFTTTGRQVVTLADLGLSRSNGQGQG